MKTEEVTEVKLTPAQKALSELWDEHVRDEFALKDANAAVETMTSDAHVTLVPVLTGGVGKEQVREFYAAHFIPKMPPDIEIVSRLPNDWRRISGGRDDHPVYAHNRT